MNFLMKITLVILLTNLALMAQSIATITAMKGSVKITNASGSKNAALGAKLEKKDSVVTGEKSKVQLIFKDETIVTIGKNSHFSISEYIYDETQEPSVEFSLLKGAMSTITGKIGKIAPEKFKVKTKTATIGIRGTNFTVMVSGEGITKVYCTYGAISININQENYIVNQGYYLENSSEGEISQESFDAGELKDMKKNSFGANSAANGSVSKDGTELGNSTTIDTTQEDLGPLVSKTLIEETEDASRTNKILDPITEIIPKLAVISTLKLSGWSVDYNNYSSAAEVSLSFQKDGSFFDSSNSWIKVIGKDNQDTHTDDWQFFLASTPTSYTDKNNFTIALSSVVNSSDGTCTTSTTENPNLISGSMGATVDLSSNDTMIWGYWNADITFESGTPLEDRNHHIEGLWVSGEPTDAGVIAALSGVHAYLGKWQAFETEVGTSNIQEGTAALLVDFGEETADLLIVGDGDMITGSYSFTGMTVDGNTISGGSLLSDAAGEAQGTFYGTDGKSVGGNFQIQDDSTDVQGVYQVATP